MTLNWMPRYGGSNTWEAYDGGQRYSLGPNALGQQQIAINGITAGTFGRNSVNDLTFKSAAGMTTTMTQLPDHRRMFSSAAGPIGYSTPGSANRTLFNSSSGPFTSQLTPLGFTTRPGYF
jgi:hypothetical protein